MQKIIRMVDSTRYTTTFNCPRERYWLTEHEGRGIVYIVPNEHTVFGSAIHEGYETLLVGRPLAHAIKVGRIYLQKNMPDIGLTPDGHPRVQEYTALLEGSLTCFAETQLDSFLERFEVLPENVEKEIVIPLGEAKINGVVYEIVYATRLDIILRDRADEMRPCNLNIKSSQYINDLADDLELSPQLMMEAAAAAVHLGTPVTATVILGMDKGRLKSVTEAEKRQGLTGKRLLGPLTYCYMDNKGLKPEFRHDYKSGWVRTPAWIKPGMKKWLAQLPVEVKQSRVVMPVIYHDLDLIEELKQQIFHEELRRAPGQREGEPHEEFLNRLYPQNFKNCNKHAGFFHHKCPYKEPCLEGFVDIGGRFQYRDANHPIEETLWEQED